MGASGLDDTPEKPPEVAIFMQGEVMLPQSFSISVAKSLSDETGPFIDKSFAIRSDMNWARTEERNNGGCQFGPC